MRFYQHAPELGASVYTPLYHYSSEDCGSDAEASLVHNERPTRHAVHAGPQRWERYDAARALKFWRRFHKSGMRQMMQETLDGPERLRSLDAFLRAFNRMPTAQELEVASQLLNHMGPGATNSPGALFQMAGLVTRLMSKIPQTFLDYFQPPPVVLRYQDSDDDLHDMEPIQAGAMELLPRERYLPKLVKRDLRSRNALTRWRWLEKLPPDEPDPAHVMFLVDASGSMDGEKLALAIAAALRLASDPRIRATMRFVSDLPSPIMDPVDAVAYACSDAKSDLGGGDSYGTALVLSELQAPQTTDFVVVSDFCTEQHFSQKMWPGCWVHSTGRPEETTPDVPAHVQDGRVVFPTGGRRMHAVAVETPPHTPSDHRPWWTKAYSRTNFASLLSVD